MKEGDEEEAKEHMTEYFDQIHTDFVTLRDYIAMFTFAIPAKLFSGYQTKL